MSNDRFYSMPAGANAYQVCMLLCNVVDEAEELLCLVDKPLAKQHLLDAGKCLRWAMAELGQARGTS